MSLTVNSMKRAAAEKVAMFNRNLAAQLKFEAKNPLVQSYYAAINITTNNAPSSTRIAEVDNLRLAGLDEAHAQTLRSLLKQTLSLDQYRMLLTGEAGLTFRSIGEIAALNALSDYDLVVNHVLTKIENYQLDKLGVKNPYEIGETYDTNADDANASQGEPVPLPEPPPAAPNYMDAEPEPEPEYERTMPVRFQAPRVNQRGRRRLADLVDDNPEGFSVEDDGKQEPPLGYRPSVRIPGARRVVGRGFMGRGFSAKGLLAKEQVRAGNDNPRYKISRVGRLV